MESGCWLSALIFVFLAAPCVADFGIISGAVVGGVAVMGVMLKDTIKCSVTECCGHSKWHLKNLTGLKHAFETQLHGQHLVSKAVYDALRSHLSKTDANPPSHPLVLSFHGWTGCGKNHVSKMIAEHIFKEGLKSKYVVTFISTLHFSRCLINSCPEDNQLSRYREFIQNRISKTVSLCRHSLFIFDETDKMPVGLLDTIAAFLDHRAAIDGVDYRFAIFVFLSNAGGGAISQKAFQFNQAGRPREEITMHDLDGVISFSAFNSKEGGLKRSSLIDHNLIDYYIPFLPLERSHVEACIRDYLRTKRLVFGRRTSDDQVIRYPTKESSFISRVLRELDFDKYNLYSVSGCKRIPAKVEATLPDFEEDLVDGPWRL